MLPDGDFAEAIQVAEGDSNRQMGTHGRVVKGSLLAWIISENLIRRHLPSSQGAVGGSETTGGNVEVGHHLMELNADLVAAISWDGLVVLSS